MNEQTQEQNKDMRTAAQHIEAWARFLNDGAYRWPGPEGLSNPGSDEVAVAGEDIESFKLVDSVLGDFGRPELLRQALIHVYWKGEPLAAFHPLEPGQTLQRGVAGLGWTVRELVEVRLKLLERAIGRRAGDARQR
jgi:hypothetical protein